MDTRKNPAIKRQVLWMADSALVALLALCLLLVLASFDLEAGQNGFLLSLLFCTVLWLSLVVLFVSFLCWMASVIFKLGKRDAY